MAFAKSTRRNNLKSSKRSHRKPLSPKSKLKKSSRRSHRKSVPPTTSSVDPKSDRGKSLHLLDLPNQTLQNIFSYIPVEDLFYNVRPVCKRFEQLAMSPVLWKKIEVDDVVPTNTLRSWLRSARLLKHFGATHRNDANCIAEEISKSCRQLESIRLQNCWGSPRNCLIYSNPLCNLVTRCRNLHTFNLEECRFLSCKYFRLISRDCRNGHIMKNYSYTGPISPKQLKVFLAALREYGVDETATIGNVNVDLNHRFKLRDILSYIYNEPNGNNDAIIEIWENMNFGPGAGNEIPAEMQNNLDREDDSDIDDDG